MYVCVCACFFLPFLLSSSATYVTFFSPRQTYCDQKVNRESETASQVMEETPTSVTDAPWIYERQAENVKRNYYPLPEESGKWMMFYHVSQIDDVWSRATQLYRSGQLPDIRSMKVSTAMPTEYSPDQKVLIFYCGPASNKNKMLAIGRDLVEKMEYSEPHISYKTDLQTIQGVRGSIYKIKLA